MTYPDGSQITTLPVHIKGTDVPLDGAARRRRRALRTNTFTLTATSPAQLALPAADTRLEAWITAAASPGQTEVTPANPAAGSGFTYTNTTGAAQQLTSVKFTLTTDAVVANRFAQVQIRDASGATVSLNGDLTATPASSTLTVVYAAGLPNVSAQASGTTLGGLPAITLLPGWQVTINISAIDAGDQVSAIVLTFANPAPVIYMAPTQASAAAGGGSAQISGSDTTPFPVNTTDAVWISAAGGYPVTVSVLAIYEEPD